jgi:hypothetical protein
MSHSRAVDWGHAGVTQTWQAHSLLSVFKTLDLLILGGIRKKLIVKMLHCIKKDSVILTLCCLWCVSTILWNGRENDKTFWRRRCSQKTNLCSSSSKSHYNSSVQWLATGWSTGIRFPGEAGILWYALGPIQAPIQWVPVTLFPGINWPERETDHSSPCSYSQCRL